MFVSSFSLSRSRCCAVCACAALIDCRFGKFLFERLGPAPCACTVPGPHRWRVPIRTFRPRCPCACAARVALGLTALAKVGPSAAPWLVGVARTSCAALGWKRGPSVLCRAACLFPLPALGSRRHPNAWLARLLHHWTWGGLGRPMDCVCDARAQPFQALGLERAIQAAEVAALDRGGTLPPLPEPGCASPLG